MRDDDPPDPEKVSRPEGRGVAAEAKDTGPSDPAVDERAWAEPGTFAVEREGGRVTRIEGWLSRPGESRGAEDKALQSAVRREGGEHLRELSGRAEEDKPRDACHLIAVDLGGPRVDTHGEDLARANLLLGDQRINRSYLAKAEGLMRVALAQHGEVYCQVDVQAPRNEPEAPSHLTHRLFRRAENGQATWLAEITTKINDRPAMTAGEAESAARGGAHRKWEQ